MMYAVAIRQADSPEEFRVAARRLLAAEIDPSHVAWSEGAEDTLFAGPLPVREHIVLVPRGFVALMEQVACFRDPCRWSLLYQALWRIQRNERFLLDVASDPLTHRLRRMAAGVKHDQHRMTAFVRFRRAQDELGDCFIAWYQPEHRVLRRTASFFIDRFASMRFAILTQDVTLLRDLRSAAQPWRCSVGRRHRSVVATLLQSHVQPGASQSTADEKPHAKAFLARPAGSVHYPEPA